MAIREDVQQPAVLNRAIHTIESVLAKRIFYAVMSQIKKGYGVQKDIYNEFWLEVPTNILGNQHYKDLNKATDELQNARFKFLDEDNQRFDKIVPFPHVMYEKRWGSMKIKIDSGAFEYLAELTKGYFWYKLKAAISLSSKYSQRWYELFSEKKDLKQWRGVEVDYIRKIMGADELEYKKTGSFFQRVIYEPIKEINEKTELFITHKPMMDMKKPIIGFDFTIQGQKEKGESEAYRRIEDYYQTLKEMSPMQQTKELTKVLQEYEISAKDWNEIMSSQEFVNEIMNAHAQIQGGTVIIKTTKAQYMGGVIKKIRKALADKQSKLYLNDK